MKDVFCNVKWDAIANAIYEDNVVRGWWDPINPRDNAVSLVLIHSELTEAYDGYMSGAPDEHLPHYPNYLVELADAAIRILDLCGHNGWSIDSWDGSSDVMACCVQNFDKSIEQHLLFTHAQISYCLESVRKGHLERCPHQMQSALYRIIWTAKSHVSLYVFLKIVSEKHMYNGKRKDHQKSHRASQHGKKF